MTSAPRVSVVLPTHNRARELPRSLDSVLAQTYPSFEVVVVDDASTDATPEVLAKYEHDPRVRLVRSTENLGGGGARNRGVQESKGDLIAFQDSDDYWLPYKLHEQVAALDRNPPSKVCYCGSLYFGNRRSYYLPSVSRFSTFEGDLADEVLKGSPASTQTLLMRRALFEDVGGFDPDFKRFQDWDLVIRLAQRSPFTFVQDPLVLIFLSEVSLSTVPINDAVFRAALLTKYQSLFGQFPAIESGHHYIAARTWQKNRKYRSALTHYRKSIQLKRRALVGGQG